MKQLKQTAAEQNKDIYWSGDLCSQYVASESLLWEGFVEQVSLEPRIYDIASDFLATILTLFIFPLQGADERTRK